MAAGACGVGDPSRRRPTACWRMLAAREDRDAFCGAGLRRWIFLETTDDAHSDWGRVTDSRTRRGLAPTSRWRVACATRSTGWKSRVGTLRGGATVFALAIAVFGIRSIALPVIPGRDFGTYIGYYAEMWDWHSVVPMSMLYRTPLAPLVIGGTLDLVGGWGLEVVMALLFAASVVAWTRTALAFGPRAALVTAVALLVYPGYGILFHTPASEPVAAAAFAAWALAVTRAWVAPSYRTVRRRRRCDCGGRPRSPRIPAARARLGAAVLPFACPGARGSCAPPPVPASRSRSWARGRSQTGSVTTTTPSRAAPGRSSRSTAPSRPTTSSARATDRPRESSLRR